MKDGAWGTARNPDFIRQLDHWELNLNAESESIRFRAWLLNTFASMVRGWSLFPRNRIPLQLTG